MKLTIEIDREEDGRYFAEVMERPGVITYGKTRLEAVTNALALLEEVEADEDGDRRWEELFADPLSPELLDRLASEAQEEHRQGRTRPIEDILSQIDESRRAYGAREARRGNSRGFNKRVGRRPIKKATRQGGFWYDL